MRPLELVVDGLTCFRERQTVDFRGLGVVAIAGPTGAGKSSLLDAMILALYGHIPRMGKQGVTELIAHGRKAATVRLDFQVGTKAWRVSRTIGKAATALLSELVDGNEVRRASGIEEVKRATRDILGIDGAAFTQAVILPQGEFQQFLKSAPADRRRTLTSLLGLGVYDIMRTRADVISKALKSEIDGLERRLASEWSEVVPAAVQTLETRLSALTENLPELEAQALRVAAELARVRAVKALGDELVALDERLRVLEASAERVAELEMRKSLSLQVAPIVPVLDALDIARRDATEARAKMTACRAQRTKALASYDAAKRLADEARHAASAIETMRATMSALDSARGVFERRALLVRMGVARAAGVTVPFDAELLLRAQALAGTGQTLTKERAALAKARAELEKERRTATQRRTAEAQADAQRRDAEVLEAAARAALTRSEGEHRAALVREGLAAGEPCPVCAQVVGVVPPPLHAEGLEAARRAAEDARMRAEAMRTAALSARTRAEQSERAVEALDERVAELEAAVSALEAPIVALVPASLVGLAEGRLLAWKAALESAELAALDAEITRLAIDDRDPVAMRNELDERIRALERGLRAAEAQEGKAERGVAESVASLAAADEAEARAETRRAELQASVDSQLATLGLGPEAARALALSSAELNALEREIQTHHQAIFATRERRLAVREQLGTERVSAADVARIEVEHGAAWGALEAARAEHTRLDERLRHLRPQLDLAEAARARVCEARLRYDVHARLAEDLKIDRFQAYVLEEAMSDLVRGASARLARLSGDRYGLVADEKSSFLVIDFDNAGEKRSTDTLSGGETFLTSLALALELSEQIQIKAGKIHLESLFIDEGFGTLDPETLDVVAQAIEALAGGGRLVGLITHVADLSARMPHRIRVEKGSAGVGSTVRIES